MILSLVIIARVSGHGYLFEPPGRSSYHLFTNDPNIGGFIFVVGICKISKTSTLNINNYFSNLKISISANFHRNHLRKLNFDQN